jgi:transposase-like protein
MTRPLGPDAIYLKRRFDAEIIVLCVRWYITYELSYRHLAAMMAERLVVISPTIMRWVIRYAPEFNKRCAGSCDPAGCSWRVDETYIAIKGNWHYLYRTVDKHGCTVRLFPSVPRLGAGSRKANPLFHSCHFDQEIFILRARYW